MPTAPATRRFTAWHAAAIYTAAAVAWTWPLSRVMSTAIAWDLGDPAFVAWVMGWVNDSVLALARGDGARFLAMWDAPIFHPAPLALAFSEHFIPQALMVLPIHAATGNIVLCYNVAVLATFVLSGTGMFLLARELTGSAAAAILAGAAFAFTPYRVDQLSHMQILSSQWMPLALYGLRRYFTTGRARPLVWATLALVALNLSTGYYLFFFLPFVVAYVLGEMWARGRLADARTWRDVSAAGAATLLLTLPFLLPYLAVRLDVVTQRPYAEIVAFSADVLAYVTASAYVALWESTLTAMHGTAENALFPGLTVALFAAATLVIAILQAGARWRDAVDRSARDVAGLVLMGLGLALAGAAVWTAATGGQIVDMLGVEVRLRNFSRMSLYAALAFVLALALSRRLRRALTGARGSLAGPALVAAFAAFALSLGPRMEWMDRFFAHGPYAVLLKFVPGFDGLRVPSRFAMLVVLWLSVAAAYAAAALARRGRWGTLAVLGAAALAVAESRPIRFQIDQPIMITEGHAFLNPAKLADSRRLYERLAGAGDGVLIEFPFAVPGWDIQYMLAQRRHGMPLVNGYSGHVPASHKRLGGLHTPLTDPGTEWDTLRSSGATHAIVHEWAFRSLERGKNVSAWLAANGAVELDRSVNDVLFRLPNPR